MATRRKYRHRGGTAYIHAICIPCVPKDINRIHLCFESIVSQKPNKVYVSISSANAEHKQHILDIAAKYNLTPTVVFTNQRILAGGNRNRAAEEAVKDGATLLHFFDADDIMHPKYIEIVEKYFKKYPITGLLHACIRAKKHIQKNIQSLHWNPIPESIYTQYYTTTKGRLHSNKATLKQGESNSLAAGHLSVLASFWKTTKYNEDINNGENQNFNSKIITSKQLLGYTPNELSYYMR
jgi:hypothetical protein